MSPSCGWELMPQSLWGCLISGSCIESSLRTKYPWNLCTVAYRRTPSGIQDELALQGCLCLFNFLLFFFALNCVQSFLINMYFVATLLLLRLLLDNLNKCISFHVIIPACTIGTTVVSVSSVVLWDPTYRVLCVRSHVGYTGWEIYSHSFLPL